MKKAILFLAAVALLASCTAETAETTAAPAETTTLAPETAPAPSETTTASDDLILIDAYGQTLSFDRADKVESRGTDYFDSYALVYGFGSAGVYDDSDLHPERFDFDTLLYTPAEEYEPPALFPIRAGDTVGGYRIQAADTSVRKGDQPFVVISTLDLDGEYPFTGILSCYSGKEPLAEAGELRFFPAEPLTDFPLVYGFGATELLFPEQKFGLYSELGMGFHVGNLFTLEEKQAEVLNGLFGAAEETRHERVTVTLGNITVASEDVRGPYISSAEIVEVSPQ